MFLMSIFITLFLSPILSRLVSDNIYRLQAQQIGGALLLFLLPPLMIRAYSIVREEVPYFTVPIPKLSTKEILYPIALSILSFPLISAAVHLFSYFSTPSFLVDLEKEIEMTTTTFLSQERPLGVALTFLSLCVVAPIAEEVFFRGAILGWFINKTRSDRGVHLSVWIVAILFSLSHLEWSGLMARILMGAIIGYLAVWRGIPSAIILHLLNNLGTYILYRFTGQLDLFKTDGLIDLIILTSTTIISTIAILFIFKNLKHN